MERKQCTISFYSHLPALAGSQIKEDETKFQPCSHLPALAGSQIKEDETKFQPCSHLPALAGPQIKGIETKYQPCSHPPTLARIQSRSLEASFFQHNPCISQQPEFSDSCIDNSITHTAHPGHPYLIPQSVPQGNENQPGDREGLATGAGKTDKVFLKDSEALAYHLRGGETRFIP